jgi:hypothetical protein
VGRDVPDLPGELEHLIDRCLAKRKAQRFDTADALLAALEALLPGHFGQRLPLAACPYPGLTAFQEADAGRFFGRTQEVARVVGRLRERPLVAVVGPSGVGKSSFVRAGVIPTLKHSGEAWEVFVIRPGRSPLASLANLLGPITHATGVPTGEPGADPEPLESRLRREPGTLGSLLRSRARSKSSRVLLFVDQFEELYTLSADAEERRAFTACLAGMADDAAAPLRVLVSMRSDFLDRVAEDPRFVDELSGGLVFLQSPDRQGLREALLEPLAPSGCRFESDDLVESMLDVLASTPGALPLLQFTATKLWEARDPRRNLLTERAYHEMSGVAGALATHAGEVHAGLPPAAQKLARTVLLRLVTADGTRALVEVEALRALAEDPAEVQRVIDHLVQARLLVVHRSAEAEAVLVELVHESLITGWPTLKRWVDETRDDAAFLEQLRQAARQWDARGRPTGLLWRAEAMEEARRFRQRHVGRLSPLEQAFLDAVSSLATRTARVWRVATAAAMAVLLAVIGVGAVALLKIQAAERRAVDQASAARRAERTVKEQLAVIQTKEAARRSAARAADQAGSLVRSKTVEIQKAEVELARKNQELELALKQAREATARAEKASDQSQAEARRASEAARRIEELARAEREAKDKLAALLKAETARLAAEQKRTAELRRRLAELKPATTLPP